MVEHHDAIIGAVGDHEGELWGSPSGRFPIISHVCREARELVLKSHIYVAGEEGQTDDDGVPRPEWSTWNESLPVRLRKGFDVVHLHWNRSYDRPIYLPAPPNPLPYFQWLANQAATASVSADLLYGFDSESSTSRIARGDFKYFSPRTPYHVVLTIVELHMTHYEAAHAGVFGRLGEEPIQLVDPRDTAAVAAFRDVWRRHRLSSEEPEVAKFFSHAVDSAEAYCARVEQWRQELERWWIWRKCEELGVRDQASLSRIWPDSISPPVPLFPALFPSLAATAPTFFVDWTCRALDREHPWVQAQLAVMPRFEPALMFRHCTHMCGLPSKPKRIEWRAPRGAFSAGAGRGGMVVTGGRGARGGRG
ncbi:hypothetical protein N658DRAFT_478099 [Parathielavia hyrcaniae]|uniref:Uncharacterized protein n=1 Tax=Parathielavia hyrcaniae TaxID=113614 RepID=A0AAN6PZ08_9PEZI|nr:hypothetical protein N658DRAFT_478099 [Parathielavia hyrcaniae]